MTPNMIETLAWLKGQGFMTKQDAGIDYGLGLANIDRETGIRFGVISQGSCMPEAIDDMEAEYPEIEHDEDCSNPECCDCGCYNEPIGFTYDRDGYKLESGVDGFGIFVIKSPYYTLAMFCSPCAPGAGNLDSPSFAGVRTYCLGPEWFDDGIAPYPVHDATPDVPQNAATDSE